MVGQSQFYRGDKPYSAQINQIVCAWDGCIMHLATGYPGGMADTSVYFASHVDEELKDGEHSWRMVVIEGMKAFDTCHRHGSQKENPNLVLWNDNLSHRRSVVEHVIGRIDMSWNILTGTFRYSRHFHPLIYQACELLTNRLLRLHGYLRKSDLYFNKFVNAMLLAN